MPKTNQKTKISKFFETLDRNSKAFTRPHLPWRRTNITPYEVWLSEILLQQTQVDRVIPFYTNILKTFPTIVDLSKVTWDEFYPYYKGLGYYSRGKNLLKTAQIITNTLNGHFPQDKTFLLALPGIGEYTATAILSFAFDQPHLALDTNLKRVIARYFNDINPHIIEKILRSNQFLSFRKINGELMDFASQICTSKSPKCEHCPFQITCNAYQTGNLDKQQTLTRKKQSFKNADALSLVFLHENHSTYYSSDPNALQPFEFYGNNNSRSRIKKYFLKTYNLEVSVRPPAFREIVDNKPIIIIFSQIQKGIQHFKSFSREDFLKHSVTALHTTQDLLY